MVSLNLKIYTYIYIKSFFFKFIFIDLNFYLNNFYKLKTIFSFSIVALPTKIKKFTVVRSPFVSKLSREQFELKTYKNVLILKYYNKILFDVFYKNLINFKNTYLDFKVYFNYFNDAV